MVCNANQFELQVDLRPFRDAWLYGGNINSRPQANLPIDQPAAMPPVTLSLPVYGHFRPMLDQ